MDRRQPSATESETANQLASDIVLLAALPLQEVLAEAAAARFLRVRIGELEAALEQQSQELEARIQDREQMIASILVALEEERQKRAIAEQEPQKPTSLTLASSPAYKHFFGPAWFLDAKDLLALGSASSVLCKLAQEDGFWRTFCLRQFKTSVLQHCANYRATLMANKTCTLQKHMERRHAEQRVADLREQHRLQAALQDRAITSVRWTISRPRLYHARTRTAIRSPPFIVRGIRGHFEFFPKGTKENDYRCAFFIYPHGNKGVDMWADVVIGDEELLSLTRSWEDNDRNEGFGEYTAGWWYGNPSSDLVIQVDFKTFERRTATTLCTIRST